MFFFIDYLSYNSINFFSSFLTFFQYFSLFLTSFFFSLLILVIIRLTWYLNLIVGYLTLQKWQRIRVRLLPVLVLLQSLRQLQFLHRRPSQQFNSAVSDLLSSARTKLTTRPTTTWHRANARNLPENEQQQETSSKNNNIITGSPFFSFFFFSLLILPPIPAPPPAIFVSVSSSLSSKSLQLNRHYHHAARHRRENCERKT